MRIERLNYELGKGWDRLEELSALDSERTLVMAFCAPVFAEESAPLEELCAAFSHSIITGCSTSGEIHGSELKDRSISVGIIHFDQTELKIVHAKVEQSEDSEVAGEKLAAELVARDLKGVLVLCDGLQVNGSALLKGFNRKIDSQKVTVAGGLAGDGNHFNQTWVLSCSGARTKSVAMVGLYGDSVQLSCSSQGGYDVFGVERTITKSSGNILYQIDGRPALDLYKSYLGDLAKDLPGSGLLFPLQIRDPESPERKIVRTLLNIDEENSALVFAGDVPEGFRAQLMRANHERVIDAAGEAGDAVSAGMKGPSDGLTLAISCVCRRLALGERTEEEIESLSESIGSDNIIGFYSYGELGPVTNGAPIELLNQSMTVLSISENAEEAA